MGNELTEGRVNKKAIPPPICLAIGTVTPLWDGVAFCLWVIDGPGMTRNLVVIPMSRGASKAPTYG